MRWERFRHQERLELRYPLFRESPSNKNSCVLERGDCAKVDVRTEECWWGFQMIMGSGL